MRRQSRRLSVAILLSLSLCTPWLTAAEVPNPAILPDAPLNEKVLDVPGDPDRPVTLEVFLFTPEGPGPFPLAVVNHGATGKLSPDLATRHRFTFSTYYFLSRGYAVALPMMRGFGGSGGEVQMGKTSVLPNSGGLRLVKRRAVPRPTEGSFSAMEGPYETGDPSFGFPARRVAEDCDYRTLGLKNARDIKAVIDHLSGRPEIDGERVVVAGQSLGGWNTLALGALEHPKVRGLINFVGGVKTTLCSHPGEAMQKAAGYFGAHTKVPSLWFYGENDKLFPPLIWAPVYKSYVKAGGMAELVPFGRFMDDAHRLLSYPEGLAMWGPKVDAFLEKVGLLGKLVYPGYIPIPFPKATDYAKIDDVAAVPYVDDQGREIYRQFLRKPKPRVFVITPRGAAWTTATGFDPLARALKACRNQADDCQVYAVDDDVVWRRNDRADARGVGGTTDVVRAPPTVVPPPIRFAALDDRSAIPYINDGARQSYQRFLDCQKPRAFVIAPDGAWYITCRGEDPQKRAMDACSKRHQGCRVYAVDDDVVWVED
jgi:dienelactone hydrolase